MRGAAAVAAVAAAAGPVLVEGAEVAAAATIRVVAGGVKVRKAGQGVAARHQG